MLRAGASTAPELIVYVALATALAVRSGLYALALIVVVAGTVIGAAFDGNIHSLGGSYGYQGEVNRTVVVSTAAVQEALETIYPAPWLVKKARSTERMCPRSVMVSRPVTVSACA